MVTITKDGNSIKFTFADSQYYLYGDGIIEAPVNSLSLVIDESDMITFRKASSNDIFISVPLDETNFSAKADVIDFYKNNMVGSTGGGSSDAFTGVSYDSTNQEIIFTNQNEEEVATLDASAFVIDGMVDNVYVDNGYLVIDFNTASGKQDIYIPLSSFFDASAYYTKSETDGKFLTVEAYNPKETAIAEALTELNENKADKDEVEAELGSKQDTLTAGTNITIENNVISAAGGGMSDDMEQLIATSLVDLNDRKMDITDANDTYQKKGDYATNDALALKADISTTETKAHSKDIEKVTAYALNDLNNKINDLIQRVEALENV